MIENSPAMTLIDAWQVAVRQYGQRTAIVGSARRVTYRELDSQASDLVAQFRRLGVAKSDVV